MSSEHPSMFAVLVLCHRLQIPTFIGNVSIYKRMEIGIGPLCMVHEGTEGSGWNSMTKERLNTLGEPGAFGMICWHSVCINPLCQSVCRQ